MDQICVQVLGRVAVVRDGRADALPRAQARGVLALLALNAGRVVSLDQVASAMWGGDEPATARAQIHTAVSSIRRLLAGAGMTVTVGGGRFGYELTVDPAQVDALRFEQMVRRVPADSRTAVQTAARLREALTLWRGEPLADAAGAFVDGARQRLTDRRLTAIDDLAAADLAAGRAAEVAAELAPVVGEYPGREQLRGRLMIALFRSGRQAEALRLYHDYRHWLADGEGLDPGAELTAIADAILRDRLPAADMDDGRADGRGSPVAVDGSPLGDPRPAVTARQSPYGRPNLLPPGIPDFVGRDAELDMIASALGRLPGRFAPAMVTVSGLGGVGKTTLVVHAGRVLADQYPDGCLYADLRGATPLHADPAVVLGSFLRALGVGADDLPPDADERLALYRSVTADQRLLVVLDDARDEAQVRPLIPAGAGNAVLVCARSPLAAVDGATPLRLTELSEVDGARLLEVAAGVTGAEALAIARLCGGLPLAVRIVGARLAHERDSDPAQLRQALADERARLDRLSVGDRDVRGTLALSLRTLRPLAVRLFARLGSMPLLETPEWAAHCLLDAEPADARAALGELVDAALVTMANGAAGPRYRMHPLVQALAREQPADGADEARLRVYQGLAGLVVDHDALQHSGYPTPPRDERWYRAPALTPTGDPSAWFATERDLIFAAVGDAHRHGDTRLAAALLASATNLSDMSSAMVEWAELAERLLPDLRQRPDHIGEEAALLLAYGGNLLRSVRIEAALPPLRRARRLFQALDDAARAATSAVQIAVVHRRHGHIDLANAYLAWAIDRFAVAGHPPQEVQAHVGRGNLLLRAGCHAQAEESYRTALALLRRHGESASVMYPNVLGCLAEVLSVTGQHRQAVTYFHDAMAHAAGLGDRKQWAQVQLRLAIAHQRADNRMAAAQTARQAAQALDDVGLPARASQARQLLIDLDATRQDPVPR